MIVAPALLASVILAASFSQPAPALPEAVRAVDIEEQLGGPLPRKLAFTDEEGRAVRLGDYFQDGRPVVLVLAYFRCPSLCGLVLHATANGLGKLDGRLGEAYRVLTVSIDPRDRPAVGRVRQAEVLQAMNRTDARSSWPFLVGSEPSIRALTDAVGFRYAWDPRADEYAHPAALVVLTPAGTVSRYLYGIDYSPRDLRLALVEASAGRTGSITDRILITCYRYDPASRRYGLYVFGAIRLGALVILFVVGAMVALLIGRDRRRSRR